VDKGLIPEDVIQRIRERADIVEIVGSHLSLTKAGQNFKGLCPFHSEKTPSFVVSPGRQMFHCFGCGEGGNAFTFLMKIDGCTFPAAVRTLGERYGIDVDRYASSPAARERTETRDRLLALNRQAAALFHRTLLSDPAAEAAREYLQKRGIGTQTIEQFGLGYALPAWDATMKALAMAGIKIDDAVLAGLAVPREQAARKNGEAGHYDRFRGRVMFPIHDLQKRVIGFGGRVIDDSQPKYLNSPETPLFSKGRTLYGLDSSRDGISRLQQIIIVEGYFDAIALHQSGVTNAVATLGTALTPEHVELIRRFTTHVVLVFDPDAAGVRAALRSLDLFLGSGLTVQVVSLPAGHDPDTFARTHDADTFMDLVRRAPSVLEFTVQGSLNAGVRGSVEDRVRAVEEVLTLLQKLDNAVEKAASIRHVADQLGLDEKLLVERYRAVARRPATTSRPASQPAQPSDAAVRLPKDEEVLLQLLLHQALAPDMMSRLSPDDFTDVRARRLVSLARDTAMPLNLDDAEEPAAQSLGRSLSLSELPYGDIAAAFEESFAALKLRRLAEQIQELKVAQAVALRSGETETSRSLLMQLNVLQQERQRWVKAAPTAVNHVAGGRVHG
jgi:DNA primase